MKNFIIETTTGEYVLTLCFNERDVDIFLTKMILQTLVNLRKEIAYNNVAVSFHVPKYFDNIYNESKNCINHVGIWLDSNEKSFKEWLINNIV
jgi:hypothetical protein